MFELSNDLFDDNGDIWSFLSADTEAPEYNSTQILCQRDELGMGACALRQIAVTYFPETNLSSLSANEFLALLSEFLDASA